MEVICKCCGGDVRSALKLKVLGKYEEDLLVCNKCEFLFFDKPFWLDEAYKQPINIYDTGILQRNISNSKFLSLFLNLFFDGNIECLDYAGGYGIFTRLMRDLGIEYYWVDPYTTNLVARGFEHDEKKRYTLLTAFEFLEHSVEPLRDIERMAKLSENIVISTLIKSSNVPNPEWWYYGKEHGQHVSFYSIRALEIIAKKIGKILISDGMSLHFFLDEKYVNNSVKIFVEEKKIIGWSILKKIKKIHNISLINVLKMVFGQLKVEDVGIEKAKSLTMSDHLYLVNKN